MFIQSPAYKNHLRNLHNEADSEKLKEFRKCNLFNEKTFYREFVKDLLKAKKEVVIYSPFVTKFRSEFFKQTLEKLRSKNIPVFIFTRPLEEHDYLMRSEITCALKDYKELGVCIIYLSGFIHEKLAIIDREILWEGSLNILSQRESKEMMRRIVDENLVEQVMTHLGLSKKLAEGYKYQYEILYRNLKVNSKPSFKMKIPFFLLGIAASFIVRYLFIGFKIMLILFRSIASLISFIYR
jgi:phosphatidylserine/phosphatidylglycerophosphate/cardiolipin synthase-like enzyme